MTKTPDEPASPSLWQRLVGLMSKPWATDPAPDTTPTGLVCHDTKLMRLAWAALDALDADRLHEGKRLVDRLIESYPDCLWSYELYDRYLIWARDLYEPENLIDKDFFLRESIRNLERMLALNPKDEHDVFFVHEYTSLHHSLALRLCDAVWEAGSEQEARATLAECRRHLEAWTTGDDHIPARSVRLGSAKLIETVCAAVLAAWAGAGGRVPGDRDKKALIDERECHTFIRDRWPWKAGLVPDTTPSGLACDDDQLMCLTYATWEALTTGRLRRGKRLLDRLIESYPECIWGCELYDYYLTCLRNDYEPERNLIDKYFYLQESIRNFERMLALNPADKYDIYFEAEYESLRYNLARRLSDANWEARSEQEARDAQAACMRYLDAWISEVRTTRHADYIEHAESEYKCLEANCAEVVEAWVNGERGREGSD